MKTPKLFEENICKEPTTDSKSKAEFLLSIKKILNRQKYPSSKISKLSRRNIESLITYLFWLE